jgi:nicotinic acid mononucleotide adenylyltransferase
MCHLAVESNEALVVDAREAQREGKSYTIDTLASLFRTVSRTTRRLLTSLLSSFMTA